jgi:methionine--tRNA ligase
MVSGSDSHGAPTAFAAEQKGISPDEFSEDAHKKIVETMDKLGLVYENYTTTRTKKHETVVHNIFQVLLELGYLTKQTTKQYFDTKVEMFLPDRYVRGTCPECGNPEARGDECPECGKYLEPEELLDPYSTKSDTKPELRETEHYYLDLSSLQKKLETYTEKASPTWRKWVASFSKGWLKQGLQPRPITRDMKYGISVPVEGWDEKVIYVWFEAVIGYLSAAIEWADQQGDVSLWEDFWKSPDCKHYYFIAGGNVPFHTIIWPGELLGYNDKYNNPDLGQKYLLPGESTQRPLNLPYDVPANNMLFFKGRKMSKGDDFGLAVSDMVSKYDSDLIRYFFVRFAPENHDREFTWKDFIEANNSELVGNLGNFINRTLTFTYKQFDGKVPEGDIDPAISNAIEQAFEKVGSHLDNAQFVKATEALLELGTFANKYFNDQAPWASIKESKETAGQTLYNSIQLVSAIHSLLRPFTPSAAEKIAEFIGISDFKDPTDDVKKTGSTENEINYWNFIKIASGQKLEEPTILFEKVEYTDELREVDESEDPNVAKQKDVKFEKSDELNEIPTDYFVLTDLEIKNKPNKEESEFIKDLTEKTKALYKENKDWREDNKFTGFRDLHKKYSEKDFQPSAEKLVEFILEKDGLPNINSFVDIYNSVSAYTGVSIGAHDISKVIGDAKLEILDDDKDFVTITEGDIGRAKKGEYCYTDDRGILCRLDIKQGARTKVSNKTKGVLIILQGHEGVGKKEIGEAKRLVKQIYKW